MTSGSDACEQDVAVEVAKRLAAEAENFTQDPERLRRLKAAQSRAHAAANKVLRMLDDADGFVREVLQKHATLA